MHRIFEIIDKKDENFTVDNETKKIIVVNDEANETIKNEKKINRINKS